MKKLIIALFIGLASCQPASEKEHSIEQNSDQNTVEIKDETYVCPMNCEGDKTYSESGTCPKCGMDLEKKEDS